MSIYLSIYWPPNQNPADVLAPGAQQQTRTSGVQRPDGTDRQTDGLTPDSYIDPAAHTMRALPIMKWHSKSPKMYGRYAANIYTYTYYYYY